MLTNKFARQIFEPEFAKLHPDCERERDILTDGCFGSGTERCYAAGRRLSPTQEDNFSLNSVEAFNESDFLRIFCNNKCSRSNHWRHPALLGMLKHYC